MDILIVSNMGPKPSAPLLGQFVLNQVDSLKKVNLSVDYFYLSWNGDSIFHKLLKYPVFFTRFLFSYVLSFRKFDVIHIHYYFPTIICAILYKAIRNRNVKVVVTCHGGDVYCYQPPSKLYKKLSRHVNHWIFTSEKLKSKFYRDVESSSILCAGYDDNIFKGEKSLTDLDTDCLLVGNLDQNKGIDRLIKLVKKMPSVRFTVVGSGNGLKELEQCAATNSNLKLFGSVPAKQLAVVMQKSRCLLSLSRNESFGLVLSEANACGTICIVSETDGSAEQLPNWKYTVSQNQDENQIIEAFESHIEKIMKLDEDHYKKEQSIACKQTEQYSLTKIVKNLFRIYQAQCTSEK